MPHRLLASPITLPESNVHELEALKPSTVSLSLINRPVTPSERHHHVIRRSCTKTTTMPSFGNFVHTQFVLKIPQPSASFASKTVVITGANSGLGKEAAKHIVRLGASKLIIACRNTAKGSKAKLEIESSLGCSPGIIEVWQVDVESPSSVKAFVDRANKLPRLDVLISNAGMQTTKFETSYGTERTVAVNVIGTFLLAVQMVPKLKETAKTYRVTPHLTFVGSALYDAAKYPEKHGDNIFAWLSDKKHVNAMDE